MRYQTVDYDDVTMLGKSDTVLFSNVYTFQMRILSKSLRVYAIYKLMLFITGIQSSTDIT
jgi:hypothetical protein